MSGTAWYVFYYLTVPSPPPSTTFVQVRVVYAHACLLLATETLLPLTRLAGEESITRAAVWKASTCLKEWESLKAAGLMGALTMQEVEHVATLEQWATTYVATYTFDCLALLFRNRCVPWCGCWRWKVCVWCQGRMFGCCTYTVRWWHTHQMVAMYAALVGAQLCYVVQCRAHLAFHT